MASFFGCSWQVAKRDLIISAKNLYLIGREKVKHHHFISFLFCFQPIS